jgi:NAD(P)-dependent dehydrogenase (short-subunit alcohol dehydrogenase family)
MKSLADQVAIITGAGTGIGRATALEFGRQGVKTVLVGRRSEPIEAVAHAIEVEGGSSIAFAADIAEPDAFERILAVALRQFGRVDIVMNNAVAISTGLPEDIPYEEWQRVMDINFFSVVRSNKVFLPILIDQGHGHLVNTASVDGLYGFGYDRLPYASSKAALVHLSEGLAHYLRPKGIGVTCLCPGPVESEIATQLKSFGRPHDVHGPGKQLSLISSEDVGHLVVEAVRRDRFMVYTHHEGIHEIVVRRAQDTDAFLASQIANPEIIFRWGGDIPVS